MMYYVVTELEREMGLPAILEMTWTAYETIYFLMTFKMVFFFFWNPFAKNQTDNCWNCFPSSNWTSFIKTLIEHLTKLDTTNRETYIHGNFHISLYHNGKYIIRKINTLVSISVFNGIRNYHQFCIIFRLKQIINLREV